MENITAITDKTRRFLLAASIVMLLLPKAVFAAQADGESIPEDQITGSTEEGSEAIAEEPESTFYEQNVSEREEASENSENTENLKNTEKETEASDTEENSSSNQTGATAGSEEPEPEESAKAQGIAAVRETLLDKEQRETFFDEHPWLPVLLKIILILLIARLAAYIFKKIWYRNPKNSTFLFRKFLFNIVQVLIYLIGCLLAIGQIPMLSKVVQTVLAGSGILALAISLSAQESLKSILSGLFITIFKPFEVGDRVTLINNNITGNIEDITLRHTVIKTFTNTRMIVPNSTINNEIIENSNIVDARASSFLDVWVAYESNIDQAMSIMADIIGKHPLYLDIRTEEEKLTEPKVTVYVRELGTSGVALRASVWTKTVNENFSACSDIRLQIKKAFDDAGIEIPYTKYTILEQK